MTGRTSSTQKEHFNPLLSEVREVIRKRGIFLKSAALFGTPHYILDENALRKDAVFFMKTFRRHIPNSEFFYAVKSNDLPYLVKKLKSIGYNADVAGLFELRLALKLGFEKIIFTSPGKSIEELSLAIENKDRVIINIDNEDELGMIIGLAGCSNKDDKRGNKDSNKEEGNKGEDKDDNKEEGNKGEDKDDNKEEGNKGEDKDSNKRGNKDDNKEEGNDGSSEDSHKKRDKENAEDNAEADTKAKADTTDSRVRVSIRVNPCSDVMGGWSKFGIKLINLKEAISKARKSNKVELIGLHFHSSLNYTPERYCRNIQLIGNLLKEELSEFEFLDIGGGFCPEHWMALTDWTASTDLARDIRGEFSVNKAKLPDGACIADKKFSDDKNDKMKMSGKMPGEGEKPIFSGFLKAGYPDAPVGSNVNPVDRRIDRLSTLEEFGKEISSCLKRYIFRFNKRIRIYFEPGRYISNNSTHILLRVMAEKDGGVIADGGMNLIGGLDIFRQPFPPIAPIVNLSSPSFGSFGLQKKIIYGSLCKAEDIWGCSFFGNGCAKGDLLIVLMQGSYTFSRAWRLIKETAPYAVFSDGGLALAKERERFEDRYRGCMF